MSLEAQAKEATEAVRRIFGKRIRVAAAMGKRRGNEKSVGLLILWIDGPRYSLRSLQIPEGTRGFLLEKSLPVLATWPISMPGQEEIDLAVLGDALEEAAFAGEATGLSLQIARI